VRYSAAQCGAVFVVAITIVVIIVVVFAGPCEAVIQLGLDAQVRASICMFMCI
jgi:hypothetical protein